VAACVLERPHDAVDPAHDEERDADEISHDTGAGFAELAGVDQRDRQRVEEQTALTGEALDGRVMRDGDGIGALAQRRLGRPRGDDRSTDELDDVCVLHGAPPRNLIG
jgi:hypothetical protein